MSAAKATDDQLIAAMQEHGSVSRVAQMFDMGPRTVHYRISSIEARRGIKLREFSGLRHAARVRINRDTRPNPVELEDGIIIVASDCHYWPGDPSPAHRALVKLCGQLGPKIVVINGDEFDGAAVSRHSRIGWEKRPTVSEEVGSPDSRVEPMRCDRDSF